MEHVRNKELLPFYKLTEEERCTLEREVCKGNVERLDFHHREWYQDITHLYSFTIYRTISQEEHEMQHDGYEQQGNVEPAVEGTISDEEALVVGSSSTEEYPVVKLKNLHKLNIGDVVRLKKTGELIEVGEYSEIGCSGCKFSAYDVDQHPCRKCGFMEYAYVDYKPPTETSDDTFANTEMNHPA